MSSFQPPSPSNRVRIVVATSVMLTFISYWRAAAIVLNDLASSAFYACGIAEQAVGKSAPWFIVGVMLFSFAVRAVYVESCSMFVRGGVYRVVKEALGGTLAKLSVSALMFDYILTGPISGVSAGQYIVGLINETFVTADTHGWIPRAVHSLFNGTPHLNVNLTSVVFALAVTIYYWWENTKGIQESSEKALRVMQITTVMVVILLAWSALTLFKSGYNPVPLPTPQNLHFSKESLGFLRHSFPEQSLAKMFGVLGILIAFGHSVLAMSGEESLAQVNRELAHPKLKNLKRAAIVIAIYSFVFTGLSALLSVMLIPDAVRVPVYKDNLISGLAMYMWGPLLLRLIFRGFVVVVGFLILSGAVNTAIIGSNGVLNRVSEDGVLADWFRFPHRKYGTSLAHHQSGRPAADRHHPGQPRRRLRARRSLCLRSDLEFHLQQSVHARPALQVQRRARLEGSPERHHRRNRNTHRPAFGLPRSTRDGPREPGHKIRRYRRGSFLLGRLFRDLHGFRTREPEKVRARQTANEGSLPVAAERHRRSATLLGIRPGNVLVPVRDYNTLNHLRWVLEHTDTREQDVVVMTARISQFGTAAYGLSTEQIFSDYEQTLFTRAVSVAESFGKKISLLVVPARDPWSAIAQTAHNLESSAVVAGLSSKMTTAEQAFAWAAPGKPSRNPNGSLCCRSFSPTASSTPSASARTRPP